MNPLNFKLTTVVQLGLGLTLAIVSLFAWHFAGQRDQLKSAVSIAAHAKDKHGRPVTLSVADAVTQVRILGQAVDDARLAAKTAEAADANHVITVERADARTTQEVSTDVQAQLARVQDDLAASRRLADQRLRQLAAARADQGGGGGAPVAADPDATCRAYFAATCDEVLTLLAEADANTVKLLGWQKWWAAVRANHDRARAQDPPPTADDR